MKTIRSRRGPFPNQPFYTDREIDQLCVEELHAVGLFPKTPEPVRIDRFIEKRFTVHVEYEEMPAGILGYTRFGKRGVDAVIVSKALADEGSTVADRRLNTTLAHEAGHGLLHGHLFMLDELPVELFDEASGVAASRILCRDDQAAAKTTTAKRYDGRWWEVQANKAIGGLLLPRSLVDRSIAGLLRGAGSLGIQTLSETERAEAVRIVSGTFDVNPAVARIRLAVMYPAGSGQLTL